MPYETAARLNEALDANDTAAFLHALGEIVLARGMTEIASASGLTREALHAGWARKRCPQF